MTVGIIGLFVGIILLIFIAYKGFHAVPTSLIAGMVVLLFNGVNVWTGLSKSWLGGVSTAFTSYYLLFFASTLFANAMQMTGACEIIARKFVGWFGKKHILSVLVIFCFLMCYGGVSFFVIMFAIAPIAFSLFEELNIPRKMIIVITAAGCGSFVLAAPGSPQIQNVIPTALGTSLVSAPVMGTFMTVIGTVMCIAATELIYKKEMSKVENGLAEGWVPQANEDFHQRANLPGAAGGFIPLIVVIGIIIVSSIVNSEINATLLAILAMCFGVVATLCMSYKYIEGEHLGRQLKEWLGRSAVEAAGPALTLGAVIGFGTIVSSTAAFAAIVKSLMGMNINIYWKGVISTGTIAGICGSASAGSQLTMQYLGDYFIHSGCNLAIMHRLIAMASITFDALPHATGCFLMLSYFGLNHKIAYKYIFLMNVVFPVIVVSIFTAICAVMF